MSAVDAAEEVPACASGDRGMIYGVSQQAEPRLGPRTEPTKPGSLASVSTIARMAGYTGAGARQRGYALSRTPGFPRPLDDLGGPVGRIWDAAKVARWLEANPPRRRATHE